MSSPFQVFDHPFPIHHVVVTPGGRNQATSTFTPEQFAAPVTIKGNLDRPYIGEQESARHTNSGEFHLGEMVFFTDAPLKLNDRVIIYYDAAMTRKESFRVKKLVHEYTWFHAKMGGTTRREWRLKLEEQPNG